MRRNLVTHEEREALYRAAGIIEGVACCIENGAAEALISALEMIDGVLKGGSDNG